MTVSVLVTLAPYAIEAAKLVADYIELAQKDNPTETDIRVLELRFRASQTRADEALKGLRAVIENSKRNGGREAAGRLLGDG